MRAVVHDRFGPPEVLRVEEVERPVPAADEVLVRVHATTVNRSDCGLRAPHPWFARFLGIGFLRPRQRILGSELAGVVEAVGAAVSEFELGTCLTRMPPELPYGRRRLVGIACPGRQAADPAIGRARRWSRRSPEHGAGNAAPAAGIRAGRGDAGMERASGV